MEELTIKRCTIARDYSSYEELKKRHVVAQGWSASDDISFFVEEPESKGWDLICCFGSNGISGFDSDKDKNKAYSALIGITHLRSGVIVLATEGDTIRGICEVPKDCCYFYDGKYEYANCLFPVNWIDWDVFCRDKNSQWIAAQALPMSNVKVDRIRDFIKKNWEEYKQKNGVKIQPAECTPQLERIKRDFPRMVAESRERFQAMLQLERRREVVDKAKSLLEVSKNMVLTGAPGTGKTFLAWQIASAMTGDPNPMVEGNENKPHPHIDFCQFHPSMDYTDFVEGLRPKRDQTNKDQIGFERRDGIFKSFCDRAIKDENWNFDEAWEHFIADLLEQHNSSCPLELKTSSDLARPFKVYANSNASLTLLTGEADRPSGSLTKEQIKTQDAYWKGYYDGVRNYIKRRYKSKFVFIIDEINRGDIAKIFGELFFAIDPGYRGNRGKITTQYANLIGENDSFPDGFYVPDNVYIIGTMNDIDRGVESMDFAIRRRFTWREVEPEETQDAILGSAIQEESVRKRAKNRMDNLNRVIAHDSDLGPAFQIGAAYFAKLEGEDFGALWRQNIAPLLREYLRGNERKVIEEKIELFSKEYNDETDKTEAEAGSNPTAEMNSEGQ